MVRSASAFAASSAATFCSAASFSSRSVRRVFSASRFSFSVASSASRRSRSSSPMRFSASAFPAASVSTFFRADARSDAPFSASSSASRRLLTRSPSAFFSASASRRIFSASSTASAAADSVISAADSSAAARFSNAARSERKDASRDSTVARSESMVLFESFSFDSIEPLVADASRAAVASVFFFEFFFLSRSSSSLSSSSRPNPKTPPSPAPSSLQPSFHPSSVSLSSASRASDVCFFWFVAFPSPKEEEEASSFARNVSACLSAITCASLSASRSRSSSASADDRATRFAPSSVSRALFAAAATSAGVSMATRRRASSLPPSTTFSSAIHTRSCSSASAIFSSRCALTTPAMSAASKKRSFIALDAGTKMPGSSVAAGPIGVLGWDAEPLASSRRRPPRELPEGVLGGVFFAEPMAPPNGNPSSSSSVTSDCETFAMLVSMNAAPFSAASLTRSRAFAASAIARIPKDFIAPVERHLVRPAHACAALLGLTESS